MKKKQKYWKLMDKLSIMRTRLTFFLFKWIDLLHGRRPEKHQTLNNHSFIRVRVARQLVKEGGYNHMEHDDKTVTELLHDIND